MEPRTAAELDAGLREGGIVITASDRAARAITSAFHRARRAEGLSAWPAPQIFEWRSFARAAWEQRSQDGRLLLNPLQERAIWTGIIAASGHFAALLEGPRLRLAELAMEAHELLAFYSPSLLHKAARAAWQQDAAAFSGWLADFEAACRSSAAMSASRLPLELISILDTDKERRAPLLLAGFDRVLPIQKSLFNAWGEWHELAADEPAHEVNLHAAADSQSELSACVTWCKQHVAAAPDGHVLVVTQDLSKRRGEIERAFLRGCGADRFEFSLGVPLGQIALPRSAHMLLRWLEGKLEEHELDWLLSTGYAARDADETGTLQACMRTLRRRGLERTEWTLHAFLSQPSISTPLPSAWVQRLAGAQHRLRTAAQREFTALDWAGLVPQLLEAAGWPGGRALSSAEYQAMQRWQQAVDSCGSLGFDGRRMRWNEFLSELGRNLSETLFAPESEGAPILIAGPAESAGLTADAIWFLGADEDAWPARGSMHPLLPFDVQRDARMPHASPQLDWDLGHAITSRLLASAGEVRFSYARQKEGVDTRPSKLAAQLAGAAQPLPLELAPELAGAPRTEYFADQSRIPLRSGNAADSSRFEVRGGATVLTSQSQCPFKAFATARLGAQSWMPAEAGLSPSVRGQLLHAVLHSIWSGQPRGIRTHQELEQITDRHAFVESHVSAVMAQKVPQTAREQMPERYLELEAMRLTNLVTEWLDYEGCRVPFVVAATEVDAIAEIAGLRLQLRLDRIDQLNDKSLLVIDYKTGDVSPKAWELPRPDDVQLPLYAGFALEPEQELGGLAFAKIRAGDQCFAGRIGNAASTLFANLKNTSGLVKNALTVEQLLAWRDAIEQLARDFLAGRADVDPREQPKTCDRCGLHALCRIQERELVAEDDTEAAYE